MSYQLLYAMQASSQRNVRHGDLKCENVLVSGSLSVYITDFASSFKPTYLPLDDPADFSLFFDTARRRTCYVAPERFYDSLAELTTRVEREGGHSRSATDVENVSDLLTHEPYLELLGLGRPSGSVTEAMDVFSLGCVLAELWRDGAPLFTLSQLFRYREGEFDVEAMLAEIPHDGIRDLVRRMVHVDHEHRPTFATLLSESSEHVFPLSFSRFLHLYLVELQRPAQGAPTHPDQSEAEAQTRRTHLARMVEPDERIERLYEDWATLLPFLGEPGARLRDEGELPLGVCLPHVPVPDPAPRRARAEKDGEALLVLSVVLANVRNCQRASARCHAMEIMMHLVYGWLSDEACLDRVLPYFVALLSDRSAVCRALAMRYLVTTLECVQSTTPGNTGLFSEYILPHLRRMTQDSNASVRTVYAAHLTRLFESAIRFLQMEQAPSASDATASVRGYDEQMENLRLMAQEQTLLLLTDPASCVRRALLGDFGLLCTLLGAERLENSVLSHLLTYFNDPDWELRAAFFHAIEALVPVLGPKALGRYVHPLLVQALGDEEEMVVVEALRSFRRLLAEGLFGPATRYELLRHAAGLLCHPNLWIREAAVGLFAQAASECTAAEAWTKLYVLLRPRLRCDIASLTAEALYANLAPPLPRPVLSAATNAVAKKNEVFLAYWKVRAEKAWKDAADADAQVRASIDQIVRPSSFASHTDSMHPTNADEKAMLARLAALGFDWKHDTPKLIGLWWYIVRLAQSHGKRAKAGPPSTSLDGAPPHTIFFTPHTSPQAPPSEAAIRTAKKRIQRVNQRKASVDDVLDTQVAQHAEPPPLRKKDPPSTPEKPRQPLVTAPAKAEASTSVVHAHAQRARTPSAQTQADESLQLLQESGSAPPAEATSYTSTYDGSDPFIHAHLEAVYDRMAHGRSALGVPSVPSETPRAWPAPHMRSRAKVPGVSSNVRPEGTLIAYFTEHSGPITALDLASDQLFFVSGAQDGLVKVWDTSRLEKNVTARSRLTYTAHSAPITALLVLHNTHCIVSAASDGSLHAYGVAASGGASLPKYGRPHPLGRKTLPNGEHVVCMAQLAGGAAPTLVLGTSHGRVLFWDVRCMQCIHAMTTPVSHGAVQCLALDPARHWLCTGSANGVLSLWDLRFALLLRSWAVGDADQVTPGHVYALAVHPTQPRCVFVAYTSGDVAPLFDVFDLEANRVLAMYTATQSDAATQSESRKHYRVLHPDAQRPSAALAALVAHRARPPVPPPVYALCAGADGYVSSGARPGYVVCAGSDAIVWYLDLGRVEKSVAIGLQAQGEFVSVGDTPNAPSEYSHRRPSPRDKPLASRTPLHALHSTKALSAFVKAHKDAVTALILIEHPFRCIIAGDRTGTIRVWE